MQIILEHISQGCREKYVLLIFESEFEVNLKVNLKVNIISQGDPHPQIYNRLIFNLLTFFPSLTTTPKATLDQSINWEVLIHLYIQS
jgi:hypothetical protein